jgi:hypothetical protein
MHSHMHVHTEKKVKTAQTGNYTNNNEVKLSRPHKYVDKL